MKRLALSRRGQARSLQMYSATRITGRRWDHGCYVSAWEFPILYPLCLDTFSFLPCEPQEKDKRISGYGGKSRGFTGFLQGQQEE